ADRATLPKMFRTRHLVQPVELDSREEQRRVRRGLSSVCCPRARFQIPRRTDLVQPAELTVWFGTFSQRCAAPDAHAAGRRTGTRRRALRRPGRRGRRPPPPPTAGARAFPAYRAGARRSMFAATTCSATSRPAALRTKADARGNTSCTQARRPEAGGSNATQ